MIDQTLTHISSGVMRIGLVVDDNEVGAGTGFLIDKFVVTASHVIRALRFDTVHLSFGDDRPGGLILHRDAVLGRVVAESPQEGHDLAILELSEPEFDDRHRFELGDAGACNPGVQLAFLGYPFGSRHLAAHVGYVSSRYVENGSDVIQIDGSANPANSGGPVVDIRSGKVVGCIVRAQTGLLNDFEQLVQALNHNIDALANQRASMTIGGVDPIQGLRTTILAMRQLALNMRRSSNVGIAYATSARHLEELLRGL